MDAQYQLYVALLTILFSIGALEYVPLGLVGSAICVLFIAEIVRGVTDVFLRNTFVIAILLNIVCVIIGMLRNWLD